jgi:hypothetical protein
MSGLVGEEPHERPDSLRPIDRSTDRSSTGQRAPVSGEALPLARAAALLGISAEAVRMRLRRGSINGFKGSDGRLYVRLPDRQDEGAALERAQARPVDDRSESVSPVRIAARGDDAAATEDRLVGALAERLMATLEGEVADLRRRLDEAERAGGELRRLLLMAQQSIEDLSRKVTDGRAASDTSPRPEAGMRPDDAFAAPPWMWWLWPWLAMGRR